MKAEILRSIVEKHAIGAAVIGGLFSDLAKRYGDPTDVLSPAECGLEDEVKIWNYDDLQVWSDPSGVIDRVFFTTLHDITHCSNLDFNKDMATIRETLKDCDVSSFESLLKDNCRTQKRSKSTDLSCTANGIELFATFRAREAQGPHYLVRFRLNASPDSARSTHESISEVAERRQV